ncbi:MAG: hypothetical protein NVSMB23_09460 [Myxococcales bacterium]
MPAFLTVLAVRALVACPYCFGDPNSDMVKGAKIGVAFLLIVVAGVLAGIGGIARSWAMRARALDAAELVAGQPGANSPGTISPALPSRTSSNA